VISGDFVRIADDVRLGQRVRVHAFVNLYGCAIGDETSIGTFVEIEGPSEDAIRVVQDELGLTDCEHVPSSYVRMLLKYCREQNLSKPVLTLG